MALKKEKYNSALGVRLKMVFDAAKTTARRRLDKKPHFVPIDASVFNITLGHLLEPQKLIEFREAVLSELKSLGFSEISLSALSSLSISDIRSRLSRGPLVIVYNGEVIGALFSSYASAGTNFFTPVLNKTLADFSVSGGFDIGHLVSDSKLAKSPLQLKLEEVQGLMNIYGEAKNSAKVNKYVADKLALHYMTLYKSESNRKEVEKELKTVYGLTSGYEEVLSSSDKITSVIMQKLKKGTYKSLTSSNAGYFKLMQDKLDQQYRSLLEKSSYGSTIVELDMIKTISPVLGKIGANITIIQDRAENQQEYGSKIEGALNNFVKSKIIGEILVSERFSPSLVDNIEEAIVSTLKGKKSTTKTSTKKEILDISLKDIGKAVTKGNTQKIALPKGRLPTLRNIEGQFTSIVKLENLLRAGLQQALLKNMRRPNLRNQTGRFRQSVELDKISRERDGSLRAFLSYMKYPYATFEKGGKQGDKGYYPSRLIDKSVRDLATTLVRERMRVTVQ